MDNLEWLALVASIEGLAYRVPFTAPLSTRLGPIAHREGLILVCKTVQGTLYADLAPFPGYHPHSLSQCTDRLTAWLKDPSLQDYNNLPGPAQLVLDSLRLKLTLSAPDIQHPLTVCGLLSEQAPFDQRLRGFKTLKVKLECQGYEQDRDRVLAILEQAPAGTRLRLDAARPWQPKQLSAFLADMPPDAIEYIEDPFAGLAEYAHWDQTYSVGFALDALASHWQGLGARLPGLKALVAKPLLVGLQRTQQLARLARAEGIDLVLSSVYESSVQLNFYAWLARTWQLETAQGLDTAQYWTQDVIEQPDFETSQRPLLAAEHMNPIGRLL